jgi:hypothetical protein
MKWSVTKKCAKDIEMDFSVFLPHIAFGKIGNIQVGQDMSRVILSFPTKLCMKETTRSFSFLIRILGLGFELTMREICK